MKSRALSALIAGAMLAAAAERGIAQEWSFEGEELLVTNLIGEVTVRGHDGSRIVVRAQPSGADAEALEFEVKQDGRAEFHAVFPLGESTRYTYPPMRGGRTRTNIHSWREASALLDDIYSTLARHDRIEVSGDDRGGLEAWVDLEVLIPNGVPTKIRVAVGRLNATDVNADLMLDTHSGSVRAERITGDTYIDTGSGSVDAFTIRGDLEIDTGSGSVEAGDVQGGVVTIDTGSGSVRVDGATAALKLDIDTGSGSVRTRNISATNTNIDTGSGSVTLDLTRLDDGNHVVDTGSGGVTINIPANASVRIHAETGSGGISLDVPSARLRRMSRDEVDLEIGDGRAQLEIDTGSGGVTIRTGGN